MVTMTKLGKTKQVPEHDVKGQVKNGWVVAHSDVEITAVLRKPKKNTEDTPAVEEISSEQGDNDDANEGEINYG